MAPILLNIVIHETKLQKMLAFDSQVVAISIFMLQKNQLFATMIYIIVHDKNLIFSLFR